MTFSCHMWHPLRKLILTKLGKIYAAVTLQKQKIRSGLRRTENKDRSFKNTQ